MSFAGFIFGSRQRKVEVFKFINEVVFAHTASADLRHQRVKFSRVDAVNLNVKVGYFFTEHRVANATADDIRALGVGC